MEDFSMPKKRRNSRKAEIMDLELALCLNGTATQEGPKRKNWSMHDLKTIKPLTPTQEDFFHAWYNGNNICAHGCAGTGKAQPLDAKILTPNGWTTMGEINKGEYVSTPDGKSAKVIDIFPQGKKDIFTITFHDGSTTRCCGEHLWEVYYPSSKGHKSSKHIISTFEIMDLVDESINVSIPLLKPSSNIDIDLPIDPYFLGILIGDGSITNQVMFSTKDEQIISLIEECLDSNYYISNKTSGIYDYRIVGKTKMHDTSNGIVNIYKKKLMELELFGLKSNKKFIPEIYKFSSTEQKLELIRGLLDSDGTVNKNKKGGRNVSFTTVSKSLAYDMQELLWSIGATCSISSRIPTYTYNGEKKQGQKAFTLFIAHPNPKQLFKLDRKKDLCLDSFNNGKTTLRRRVANIELSSYEEAQCIMINHPDHLYITDDYIVTHNTFLAFYLALQDVFAQHQSRIIIVRSAVTTREVGHLPGSLEEKLMKFEEPYQNILWELIGRASTYQDMKDAGLIEFHSTSFLRGLTWDNAIVIVDETENCTFHEVDNVMTRLGQNTKIIFTGDIRQTDLDGSKKLGTEGLTVAKNVFKNMESFECIEFNEHDIVRGELVKSWIMACNNVAA